MVGSYREDYLKRLEGGGSLHERDLLNILLGNAYGGKDMSAVAGNLMERFPSVTAIIEADFAEIMAVDGVTEAIAAYFKTLDRIIKTFKKDSLTIKSTDDCFEVAMRRLRMRDNEYVEIYFVNKSGKVTDIKSFTSDSADRVDVAASKVVSAISSSGAYGLYFVHNHVNTSANPSKHDRVATAKIATACNLCGIVFYDHCIVSSTSDKFSYSQSGQLKEIKEQEENQR